MANATGFGIGLEKWFEQAVGSGPTGGGTVAVKKIALEVLTRVVLKTPVQSGRARGNWFVTINEPDMSVADQVDPTGRLAIGEGTSVITAMPSAQTVIIQNNLPYIGKLESGSSQQAPVGMVAVTIAEIKAGLSK